MLRHKLPGAAALLITSAVLWGCGFQVASPDLFLLTRRGQGQTFTVLVNDGGTVRCNSGRPHPVADPLLIRARDLAGQLDKDAMAGLRLPAGRGSVYTYSVRLEHGTISFPDTAADSHHELALAEQFALQALQGPCAGAASRT